MLTLLGAVSAGPTASAHTAGPAATAVTASGVRSGVEAPSPDRAPPVQRGLATKNDPEFVHLPGSCSFPDTGYPTPGQCWLTPRIKNAPIIFLWGDSHAWAMIPALRAAARGKKVNLVSWIVGGCTPMYPRNNNNGCDAYGQRAVQWIERKVRQGRTVRVVYGASWELYNNAIAPPNAADQRYPGYVNDWITTNARTARWAQPRAFRALNRLRVPVDVVGQLPMVWNDAPACSRGEYQCDLPRWGTIKDPAANNARIKALTSLLRGRTRVVRPARLLCTPRVCRGRLDGHPVYMDQLHVGNHASSLLAPLFAPTVSDAIRQGRAARRAGGR